MIRELRHASVLAWLAGALLASPAQAQPDKVPMTLAVGEQRVVPSAGVSSYSEATRGVVDVRLTPEASAFVIVGQREGRTSLLFLMSDGHERLYDITVTSTEPLRTDAPSPSSVSERDNIRLDFYFVQASRDYRHKLGIGWPGSVAGSLSVGYDLQAGAISDANALVSDQALPRLDLAQANGWVKLLRQAAFVTANGSEGKLSGGGELNVPVAGGLSAALQKISFGTEIRVTPRYDKASGRLELIIHADVSDLAGDGGTGVPGRMTSSLDSVVTLQLGESVVLAGLRARNESVSHAGLPWLKDLPILGGLFGSHEEHSEDSESLVLIVPSIVDRVSLHAQAEIEAALRNYDAYDGDLDATRFEMPKAHERGHD